MAVSTNTSNPVQKGCATMFPDLTHSVGSSATAPVNPTLRIAEQFCAATGHETDRITKAAGKVATGTSGNTIAATAETALTLMLMTGEKLSGKTLGIVGFGRVGRETARRAHLGFGMKILVHNRSAVPDEDLASLGAEQMDDIDQLLGQSDFVSLHCPQDAENRHLIGALQLNRMKPDACLINTAGSNLVDEEALADALWHDTIGGAGLDVIHDRPTSCDRLRGCENLVLLPHLTPTSQPANAAA